MFFILKEGFLGVPKSEKPECTRGTRGFRRQGQREKDLLKWKTPLTGSKRGFIIFRLYIPNLLPVTT